MEGGEGRGEIRVMTTRDDLKRISSQVQTGINALALVLTLLVTVTFVGFLQPPGGYDDKGHLKHTSTLMKVFVFFNSLSFYVAVGGLLMCLKPMLPSETFRVGITQPVSSETPGQLKNLTGTEKVKMEAKEFLANETLLHIVNLTLSFSLCFCVVAFTVSGFIVTNTSHYGSSWLSASIVGLIFAILSSYSLISRTILCMRLAADNRQPNLTWVDAVNFEVPK